MVQRKPTPEEQLLKLIEGQGQQPPDAAGAKPETPVTQKKDSKGKISFKFPTLNLSKLSSSLDYLQGSLKKSGMVKPGAGIGLALDIRTFNRVLIALVLAAGIYLIIDLFFIRPGKADFLAQVGTHDALYPKLSELESSQNDLSYYQQTLRKRDPFGPPKSPEAVSAENQAPGPQAIVSAPMQDLLKDFKLVGISWGEEPLAMIEDTTGRTFFLKRGQEVKGMKVQTISKEKVTLTYEGAEGELF
jgi:hypothetical protein